MVGAKPQRAAARLAALAVLAGLLAACERGAPGSGASAGTAPGAPAPAEAGAVAAGQPGTGPAAAGQPGTGAAAAGQARIGGAAGPVAAAGFDPGPIRTAAEYLAQPELAAADFERGELLGFACAACHRFRAEQGTLIGPHLQGVFGRPAASIEGYDYSPALRASGLVWTPRSLEAWLANPAGFVEGTRMAFTGYRSAEDRRDLIAYLLQVTQ